MYWMIAGAVALTAAWASKRRNRRRMADPDYVRKMAAKKPMTGDGPGYTNYGGAPGGAFGGPHSF